MAAIDWILIVLLVGSMLLGAWRGLVYEVLSLLGWVAAFFLAQWFAPQVAAHLPLEGSAEPVRYAAGFFVVFVAGVFGAGLVAWVLKKLIEAIGLRPADRTLGAAFGLARGFVLLLAVSVVMAMTPLHQQPWWRDSSLAGPLASALQMVKPVLPERFARQLPV